MRETSRLVLVGILLSVACGRQPNSPSSTPAAAESSARDGGVISHAEGDVKRGPIEIERVRIRPGGSPVRGFYANPGGVYQIVPDEEIEIWVEWTSNPPVVAPRLVVDWGESGPDNIHCGPCKLTRKLPGGRHPITVRLDDRNGGVTTRSFVLEANQPAVSQETQTYHSYQFCTAPVVWQQLPDRIQGWNIPVAGTEGRIDDVSITLRGLSYSQTADLSMMLVSPSLRALKLVQANYVFPGAIVTNADTGFSDSAASFFMTSDFGPGTFSFLPSGGTGGPPLMITPTFVSNFAGFKGVSANSTWTLFAWDRFPPTGPPPPQISRGICLEIKTVTP